MGARKVRSRKVATAHSASASDADLASYITPVFRAGCLVSAFLHDERRPFTYSEGELCSPKLHDARDEFYNACIAATKKVWADLKIDGDVPLVFKQSAYLAPARRSPDPGVVYEFQEFAINWHNTIILIRPVLTVCVQPGDKIGGEAYSKFWIKFFVPPSETIPSTKQPARFTLDEINNLHADLRVLADAILKSMRDPYCKVLRAAVEQPEITVDCSHRFSVYALASAKVDYPKFYSDVSAGLPLDALLHYEAGLQFAELGVKMIGRGQGEPAEFLRHMGQNVKFYTYETPKAYRGLFFRRVDTTHEGSEDRQEISYVGVTDAMEIPISKDDTRNARKRFLSAHMLAPYAVTAAIVGEVGSLF